MPLKCWLSLPKAPVSWKPFALVRLGGSFLKRLPGPVFPCSLKRPARQLKADFGNPTKKPLNRPGFLVQRAAQFWLTGLVAISPPAFALEWQTSQNTRFAQVQVQAGKTGFTLLSPAQTGVIFTNALALSFSLTNQIFLNGSGVAAGDMDDDGWCDLFFAGLGTQSALYRNLGQWQFRDVTREAGIQGKLVDATGAAFVDIDGDGDLDLLVNTLGHGIRLFLNNGRGVFEDASARFPVSQKGSMSLAIGDFDGDGFLDVYVANYRTNTLRDLPNTRFRVTIVAGKPVVARVNDRPVSEPDLVGRYSVSPGGTIVEHGEEDVLYRNVAGTNFVPVPFTGGAFLNEDGQPLSAPLYDWGLTAMFRDLNQDGLPDLYVCNDFESVDRIWINKGGGRFQALDRLALRKTSLFSMGIDFADLNRDGFDEIFVVDMLSRDHQRRHIQIGDVKPPVLAMGEIDNRPQYSRNTLFLNRGDGTYAEIASLSGLEASEWSWVPAFLDVDLDGYEDLLIVNGHERDGQNVDAAREVERLKHERPLSNLEQLQLRTLFPALHTPNLAFRNRHDLTFEETGRAWGFDLAGATQGMALADLDNDGDLDVVLNSLNQGASLYRNDGDLPRLAVRLKGEPPNTRGIGARISVLGGPVPQTQEMICGGRYLSSDDAMRVFAAGHASNSLTIQVRWRSGKETTITGARGNSIYEISEAGSTVPRPARKAVPEPLFEEVSALLGHTHAEDWYDDFAREPLLPKRLSQMGPGVAWVDLDGDGWEDLIIASGKGKPPAIFQNRQRAGFAPKPPLLQTNDSIVTRDQTALVGWTKGAGKEGVLVGLANYEDGKSSGPMVMALAADEPFSVEMLAAEQFSAGPLALADVDGDGSLDLFVGGQVLPGHYGQACSSRLYLSKNGKFVLDPQNSAVFAHPGMVNGALFADLNGDGQPDLLLACDWGPLRIFLNQGGRFTEATGRWGLDRYTGWWNGVAAGDFDNDGRLDIVAANWGRNSKYQNHRTEPLRLYYADAEGTEGLFTVESYFDEPLKKWVPWATLEDMSRVFPGVMGRFKNHADYGLASVEDILAAARHPARVLEVNWLETTVFFNRGDHFDPAVLPIEAQLAPAFAVLVGDFNGDGHEDIFVSQNFFATRPETPRYDGGRGLLLEGDGRGGFRAVPGPESGIKIYGDQRGAALCDYDHDGKVDLVVTQNGAATKLYHNRKARSGLRIAVRAGPGNPHGIGASLRLGGKGGWGPLREIHGGGGYWSDDAKVQVMTLEETPEQIQVRWPGGVMATFPLPPGLRNIVVAPDGVHPGE